MKKKNYDFPYDYKTVELNPVVQPEVKDGRAWKTCELLECDVYFDFDTKGRGRRRYCDQHSVEVRHEKQRKRNRKDYYKGSKTCVRCGEKRRPKEFPKDTQSRGRMQVCHYCSPFYRVWEGPRSPKCGLIRHAGGTDYFVATCTLYNLCLKRIDAELWAPCESPMGSELVAIHALPDSEYERALELLEIGFAPDGSIENQGLRWWLNKYIEVVNADK